LLLAIRHEKAGRFGNEEHRANHDHGSARLEDEGDPPGIVVLDVIAAECDGRRGYGTTSVTVHTVLEYSTCTGQVDTGKDFPGPYEV
jgi:hypothetical protein